MDDWLEKHPEVQNIVTAVCDLNGLPRGKRAPVAFAKKALEGGARMPLSALNVDIWGHDIEDSPLLFETGDQDGLLRPTERGFVARPWLETPSAMLPMCIHDESGAPFAGDPRHALGSVLGRYDARGWRVIAATELEFYLIDDSGDELLPVVNPTSGLRPTGGEVLSIRALDRFDTFFSELYQACEAMEIPADAASSESGLGQFEISLAHGPAMKAADDTWLFKLLIKGLARKHGFAATFMTKPYADQAGTGMHVHFSVLDETGRNVFDNGGEEGTALLQSAVAGCLDAMRDSTLVFAPHANSYARLVPGNHAPTGIGWGYENRTVALRIPGGSPAARRIEHRVAGGDTNPYLMLAVVLGAAMNGIDDGVTPPAPLEGNAYAAGLETLPDAWDRAVALFEQSKAIARVLPAELVRNFVLTKRQEMRDIEKLSATERLRLYAGAL
ncbi:MAG: glutamine synthetase family protein [Paracoccaceae bacterium]|nr:glutamine synthetase family protein [Paracoccaceae bacterium]